MQDNEKTHFGYTTVNWKDKEKKVAAVFDRVAKKYDLMNDLMSLGLHHIWKRWTIEYAQVKAGQTILDLAGGSGDLSLLLSKKVGESGKVILADINAQMLEQAQNRLLDAGLFSKVTLTQASAEILPFKDNSFDRIFISFGLRNVTDKKAALKSMYAATKPGGKLLILEFSKPAALLSPLYDWYSFKVLPKIGEWVAKDRDSYTYLVESIRLHPSQEALKSMIEEVGFEDCNFYNFTGGIVALHTAFKY